MVTRERGALPGVLFLWRGSALAAVWPLLVFVGLASVGVTIAHEELVRMTLEAQANGVDPATVVPLDPRWLELSTTPFTIVGLALSIFLGFRNQACYQRWWEGRILWGRLVNAARTYSRQVLTLMGGDDPEVRVLQKQLIYRMIAFTHALRLHLRGQTTWEELGMFVLAAERQSLAEERNKPMAILHMMGQRHRTALDRAWVDVFHLPILEATLTELMTIQGACERIKNTPVPVSYSELTHRIVALYVLLLPLAFVGNIGYLAPVAVVIVAYAFLGLDAVGSQIENPFEEDPNDLPLSQLSRMIENDLRVRLGERDLRPDLTPQRGLIL